MIDYDKLLDDAIIVLIRKSLEHVRDFGSTDNCLYITFKTRFSGVEMHSSLVAKYIDEMTLLFDDNFFELVVHEDYFSALFKFSDGFFKIKVPFFSIVSFADPRGNFSYRLRGQKLQNSCEYETDIVDITKYIDE